VAIEVFANDPLTTVISGGTTAPVSGTQETWTVASSSSFPAATAGVSQFHAGDPMRPAELIAVTNVSGTTWTVTRGAEGTAPVAHASGFTVQQVVSAGALTGFAQTASLGGPADWLNAKNQYGADPTGVADAAAVIQSAMNAQGASNPNGGVVYLPAGTFLISSASLQPVTKVRLMGAGKGATTLVSTTISIWNMGTSGVTSNAEIDHLTMDCTGADTITGANLSKLYLHDCELIQRSAGFSVWNGAGLSQMIECRFERNEDFAHGATRTVPAWNLTSAASAVINQNVWRDIVSNNSDNDAAQFLYKIAYTGSASNAGHRSNVFENIVFERPTGGAIRLESCTGTLIDQCTMFDIASLTVGASLISLAKNASAPAGCQSTVILNYARLGGTSLNGNFDIQLDANCVQTAITAPSLNAGGATLALDLGSSAQVTLSGFPASYALANAAGATFADANGASVTPGSAPQPEDLALAGWAFDPALGVASPGLALAGSGVLSVIKVPVRAAKSVSTVRIHLITAGVTLTSAQNFIGVYSSAGAKIATSADQTANWGGTGKIDAALTGAPFTVGGPGSGGFVWVVLVWNGSTSPLLYRAAQPAAATALLNGNLPAALSRWGSIGASNTSLPASFTPSSITQGNAGWWAAIF
jgi:hypothetical protein